MLRFALAFVALSARQLEEDDHDHDHGHSEDEEEMLKLPLCGCLSAEQGWEIDCSKPAAVMTAFKAVMACADCNEAACLQNWAIVEAHHDLCLHDEIDEEVEKKFHELENKCPHACLVGRKDGGLKKCDAADCGKAAELTAAMKLEACKETCTPECGADYAVLRALHDTCEHDTLEQKFEELLHDVEESCEEYNCWAESSHCKDDKRDELDLADLKERAFDKCKFTEADAKLCPAAPAAEPADESAAYAAIFLAYFLA